MSEQRMDAETAAALEASIAHPKSRLAEIGICPKCCEAVLECTCAASVFQSDLPFDGPQSESYNATWIAMHACGRDYVNDARLGLYDPGPVYNWLHNTPRTSLVVELVDKLHGLGFQIVKASNNATGGAS